MPLLFSSRRRAQRGREMLERFEALRVANRLDSDLPVVRFVDVLLRTMLDTEATEARLTPTAEQLHFSLCVKGVWRHPTEPENPSLEIPMHLRAGLVARFKELAELDLLVAKRVQSGRFPLFYHDRRQEVLVEVTTDPTLHGEGILLRLLPRSE